MAQHPRQNGLDATERSVNEPSPTPQTATDETDVPREALAASIETRVDIAPILATASEADTEIRALTPEAIGHRNILLGDSYLRRGLLSAAHEHYAFAGLKIPKEKIVECGDACFEQGRIDDGLDAYAAAGVRIPKGKLEAVGDALFEKGKLYEAFSAYFVAGTTNKVEAARVAMRRRVDAERAATAAGPDTGA